MEPLIGPFGDEAVAALLGALITAAVAFWIHHRSRRRPKHLVCTELLRTSLLYVGKEVEAKTIVQYDKAEVEHLALAKLRLRNMGSSEILEPGMTIRVEGPIKLLDVRTQFPEERYEIAYHSSQATLQFDFINAYSDHQEEILLDLICDGEIKSLAVEGSGAGWSARFETLVEQQEARLAQMLADPLRFLFLLLVGFLIVSVFFEGFDRALIQGFALGGIFATATGTMLWYINWTWGRLKRLFLAQSEERDNDREPWEVLRSGGGVGCRRIVLFGIVAAISVLLLFAMYQISSPSG